MYSLIYANGCSYTGDNLIVNRYPELLAKDFNCAVKNRAKPGCCNRRIIRTTLFDSLTLPKDSLVIVQLTHSHRTEIATNFDKDNLWKVDTGDYFESVKPFAGNDYEKNYFKVWFDTYNKSAELQNLLVDVFLLSQHLTMLGLDYRFFCWDYEFAELKYEFAANPISTMLLNNKKILNFYDFSILELYKDTELYYDNSHFNELGHIKLADYFKLHVLPA
jgi:hypothetical protein